jgi:hypothetical protein
MGRSQRQPAVVVDGGGVTSAQQAELAIGLG